MKQLDVETLRIYTEIKIQRRQMYMESKTKNDLEDLK